MIKLSFLLPILLGYLNTIYSQNVAIGSQIWSSKNLDVITFRNGDIIPQAMTTEEWDNAARNKQPAWCFYNNDSVIGSKFGKLYNFYTIVDPRGLAPIGYHIPNEDEWHTLINYLGGFNVAGKKMKSIENWKQNENGTNESGFSALPSGLRNYDGKFYDIDLVSCWWYSTDTDPESALHVSLVGNILLQSIGSRWFGLSVRCIKN